MFFDVPMLGHEEPTESHTVRQATSLNTAAMFELMPVQQFVLGLGWSRTRGCLSISQIHFLSMHELPH